MSNDRARMLSLAKVLIAVAWADGEITDDEKNSLKDLIFHIITPGTQLGAQEWELLEMYMETPVDADERARLVADLQDAIQTAAERQFVQNALQQMVSADGSVPPEEQRVIDEIEQAVQDTDVGLFGALSRVVSGAVSRRSAAAAGAPNREDYFDDFLRNKVYYAAEQRLRQEGMHLDIPEAELRRLGLAGGLMTRVIHVDAEVTDSEREAMVDLIEDYWATSRETAVFIADVALASLDATYDYYRMTREFGTSTTLEERRQFIELLFRIAAADGDVSFDETEEIRLIARGLNLSHEDFIDGKLAAGRAD